MILLFFVTDVFYCAVMVLSLFDYTKILSIQSPLIAYSLILSLLVFMTTTLQMASLFNTAFKRSLAKDRQLT